MTYEIEEFFFQGNEYNVEIEVDFTTYGQNRPATMTDPAEYFEVGITVEKIIACYKVLKTVGLQRCDTPNGMELEFEDFINKIEDHYNEIINQNEKEK